MIIYAHRAFAPNLGLAPNTYRSIDFFLSKGYGVEIDVWYRDDFLYLGHDEPNFDEEIELIELVNNNILVHCKDPATFAYLTSFTNIHSFFQDKDDCALTSHHKILYHSYVELNRDYNCDEIAVLPKGGFGNAYGVVLDNCVGYRPKEASDMFKLLVLDVDGVLTNGTKSYLTTHETFTKNFNDRDFTAIKRFKAAGIPVVLLSGDKWNEGMAKERKLDFINAREICPDLDKSKALPLLCQKYSVKPEEIAYVGDDYYDISLLDKVGFPYAPLYASSAISNVTTICRAGGDGVVDALYQMNKDKIVGQYPKDDL